MCVCVYCLRGYATITIIAKSSRLFPRCNFYTEALEELNIPSLEDKHEEKEKSISNGLSKLCVTESHWDISSKYNETSKSCARNNEDTTVRNISPQLGEAEGEWNTPEQSNSEDSSLSDSDKTLVGDAPEDDDLRPPSSWDRRFRISKQFEIENWDIDDEFDYYFRATPYTDNTQKRTLLNSSFSDEYSMFDDWCFDFLFVL